MSQLGLKDVVFQNSTIEGALIQPEHTGLISTYYKMLGQHRSTRLQALKKHWLADIPDLSDENWEELLNTYYVTAISARDRIIQLSIFHRIYYTPMRLFRMRKLSSPICHKCHKNTGDLLHMLWSCEKIWLFWSQVTHFIATNLNLPNICSPKWCILGIFEDVELSSYQTQFLRFLLYYARKVVGLQWIYSTLISLNQWKNLINQVLPTYKLAYEARGCAGKFMKIWGEWTELYLWISWMWDELLKWGQGDESNRLGWGLKCLSAHDVWGIRTT